MSTLHPDHDALGPLADPLLRRAERAAPTSAERSRMDARFRDGLARHIDTASARPQHSWGRQLLSGLLGVALASAAWALVFVRVVPGLPSRSVPTQTRQERDVTPASETVATSVDADNFTMSAPQDHPLAGAMKSADQGVDGNAPIGRSLGNVAQEVPPPPALDESTHARADDPAPAAALPQVMSGGAMAAADDFEITPAPKLPATLPIFVVGVGSMPQLTVRTAPSISADVAKSLLIAVEPGAVITSMSFTYAPSGVGAGEQFVLPSYRIVFHPASDETTERVRNISAVEGYDFDDMHQ